MITLNLKSPDVAEFLGVLIGDGFIGSYPGRMIQITGNKINDKEYYQNYLIPLIKRIFNAKINFYERRNCLRLTIYSKEIFTTIKATFDFPVGKKGDIAIPKNMLESDECKLRLIRGLFDTDGSISLQRKKYPVIAIITTSKILALQIQEILNQFDFRAYICKSTQKGFKDAFRVTIFGKQKVLKWKSLIGSSNPYHIKRIDASVA